MSLYAQQTVFQYQKPPPIIKESLTSTCCYLMKIRPSETSDVSACLSESTPSEGLIVWS